MVRCRCVKAAFAHLPKTRILAVSNYLGARALTAPTTINSDTDKGGAQLLYRALWSQV